MMLCTRLSRVAALSALLLPQPVVLAQGPVNVRQSPAGGPLTFDTATGQRIKVTQVAGALVHPYSVAFPDAHTILVAERSGRLRIIKDDVLLVAAPPSRTTGAEGGVVSDANTEYAPLSNR